jgi:glycogen phosphorylase
MFDQKAPVLRRLVLLFALVSLPASTLLLPAATVALAQPDRPSVVLPADGANDGVVQIDGSSSMTAINQLLKQRYETAFPEVEVEVAANGTRAALKALLNGEIDLAAIGRPLTLEEKAKGLVEIPVSQERVAIIVSQDNPFKGSLTLDQLSQIFQGEIVNWAEVGGPDAPIRVIDRPQASDTRLAFGRYGWLDALRTAPKGTNSRANFIDLDTDDTTEVIQSLGQDGISYAIVDQVREAAGVRLVPIAVLQDVLPDSSLYPYTFSRSYAYKAELAPALQSFLGFATTEPGQAAIVTAKGNEAKAIVSALTAAALASQPSSPLVAESPAASKAAIELTEATSPEATEEQIAADQIAADEIAAETEAPEPPDDRAVSLKDNATEATQTTDTQLAEIAQDTEEALEATAPSLQPVAAEPDVAISQAVAETPVTDAAEKPAMQVIKPIPTGRVRTQPELNQQYFDAPAQAPIVVEKPVRSEEDVPATGSPQPRRIVERLDDLSDLDEQNPPVEAPIVEPAAEPIAPEAPIARTVEPVEPVPDSPRQRAAWWWLLLPLTLAVFLIRWLRGRNKPTAPAAPKPAGTKPPQPESSHPEIVTSESSATTIAEAPIEVPVETPAEVISHPEAAPVEASEIASVEAPEPQPEEAIDTSTETPIDATIAAPDASETPLAEPLVVEMPLEAPTVPVPEVVDSDVVVSEVVASEIVASEIVASEVVASDTVEADTIDAEIVEPETLEPETLEPETPEPETETAEALDQAIEQVAEIESDAIPEPPSEGLDEASDVPMQLPEPIVLEAPIPGVTEPISAVANVQPIASPSIADIAADSVMMPVPRDDAEPTVETFKRTFQDYLRSYFGQSLETATVQDRYMALAYVVRDRMMKLDRPETCLQQPDVRIVGEIAAEFMPGPHLANNLMNLGYWEQVRQAMRELGIDLEELVEQEEEPGLGKGGLGRLMVCYLDSLSTANVPAIGYGIRYEFGIFDQVIQDGWQVEVPDSWLRNGNPWELEVPEGMVEVKFGGETQAYLDEHGQYRVRWVPKEVITGIPYDTPIPGYRTQTINPLRLWKAETGNLCKVLYPVDVEIEGKALRLKQQFFLVSCALQDVLRLHRLGGGSAETLHQRFALQLNDTDPTLAVAELMRLLVDEGGLAWDTAWDVTQKTLAYTNHSLMPETLDDLWSVRVFEHFLPRHLEIIFEINRRFLDEVRAKYPNDLDRIQRVSLIDETGERYVRTTYLACVGSHAINGVSKLHTQLLEQTILRDFYDLYPEKFSNQTNGVTPRRFLQLINPRLATLITSEIGDDWITDLDELRKLEEFVDDPQFRDEWQQIKQACKADLADYIQQQTGIQVDVNSLFDVHTMRLHEYMRKHLQVLHILTLYNRIKANPNLDLTPRTFIFAGKAAPDYFTAKLIIKLIHAVAELVNHDPDVRDRLKVVFLPDYNLKVAQRIYPAADLAEYISTAGTEACSTGNMIFAMNGAAIIGTLDGSNIELRDAVGAENFFLFGLTAQEAANLRQGYTPIDHYHTNPDLNAAIDLIASGALSNGDTDLFQPLVNLLLYSDEYLLLADYQSYIDCQARVSRTYQTPEQWLQLSILTVARIGPFSSDRAIREYCQTVWNIQPVSKKLREYTKPQAG